jgi:hypothetical protein
MRVVARSSQQNRAWSKFYQMFHQNRTTTLEFLNELRREFDRGWLYAMGYNLVRETETNGMFEVSPVTDTSARIFTKIER